MTELTWELVSSLELAAADNATQLERERIIKLLEEASLKFEQYDFNAVGVTNRLIALIKGEK